MEDRIDPTEWRKATYSGGNGGGCIEVGQAADGVAVRDTKNRAGAVLRVGPVVWRRFIDGLKAELEPRRSRDPRP